MEEKTPIARICEDYGLSQTALAKRFEIPLRTLEDWEAARRTPPEYIPRLIAYQLKYEQMEREKET